MSYLLSPIARRLLQVYLTNTPQSGDQTIHAFNMHYVHCIFGHLFLANIVLNCLKVWELLGLIEKYNPLLGEILSLFCAALQIRTTVLYVIFTHLML